ncbi:MAG: hypothetical protein O7C66_06580, partial [Alphaproteobacteria bacterium]|nr:hypothetical protein [Alphaproteobacteria bacterium]
EGPFFKGWKVTASTRDGEGRTFLGRPTRPPTKAAFANTKAACSKAPAVPLIAEFSSPLLAVRCAHEFQKGLAARNRDTPEQQRMWFRAGINLGDVMIDGDNLYGESVNIAAPLPAVI